MPTQEELLEKVRELEERVCGLQGYLAESRRIWGEINEIIHLENSGVYSAYEQRERKESLRNELKQKNAELKRRYQLPPHRVLPQIREDTGTLCILKMQIDEMEGQAMAQTQQGQKQPEPDGGRKPGFRELAAELRQQHLERQPPERSRDVDWDG